MTIWNARQTPLVLTEKKMETVDAASFFLAAQDQSTFDFKPGQFVTLKVQVNGIEHARAYSISSLPHQKMLQLTIKRVAGGVVSNWMMDTLKPGDVLWTHGIAGHFNIMDCPPKPKVLLIGAGCGVTPVMSMAKYLCNLGEQSPEMLFLHAAKDIHNVIALQDLVGMSQTNSRFDYHLLLEQPGDRVIAGKESYGLISLERLERICPDYQERAIYLCGPKGLMDAVNEMLQSANFEMTYLYQEDFAPRDQAHANCDIGGMVSPMVNKEVSVHVPGFNYTQKVQAGTLLLDVLEDGDLPIVVACRSGACGACKCKITQGQVHSTSQATLTAQQIAQGYVLACSSQVISDIEVALK